MEGVVGFCRRQAPLDASPASHPIALPRRGLPYPRTDQKPEGDVSTPLLEFYHPILQKRKARHGKRASGLPGQDLD